MLREMMRRRGWRRAVLPDHGLELNRILNGRNFSNDTKVSAMEDGYSWGSNEKRSVNAYVRYINRRLDVLNKELDNVNF